MLLRLPLQRTEDSREEFDDFLCAFVGRVRWEVSKAWNRIVWWRRPFRQGDRVRNPDALGESLCQIWRRMKPQIRPVNVEQTPARSCLRTMEMDCKEFPTESLLEQRIE